MSLNLDARQRAMLQEMGITLWLPTPQVAPETVVAVAAPQGDAMFVAPAAPMAPQAQRPAPVPTPAPTPAPTSAPLQAPAQTPDAAPVQAPGTRAAVALAKPAAAAPVVSAPQGVEAIWQMAPLVQLYTPTDGVAPAAQPAADAWLVLMESPCPMTPLAGDVGRLLDNMLRALRLEQHPQVWLAGLQRPGSEALPRAGSMEPVDWQPLAPTLQAAMAQVQPARVLVLGQAVARAVLQRTEPLGQLRAQVHQLQGVPAVVTYDPAYLLRAAHAKPGAWADLCLAADQPQAA